MSLASSPAPAAAVVAPVNVPAWDDAPWTPLPALPGDLRADVCVVGLGGSGLSAIGELRRRGASVVGIDAATVACGAAGRNGGLLLAGLAPFHHDARRTMGAARAARLYRLTMDELERVAAEVPAHVRRTGSLRIAASDDESADCDAQLVTMREDDLPVVGYEGPEGRGLLFPLDGVFQPLARARSLASTALAGGARLFEHTAAVRIAGNSVETPLGTVRCQRVIVAVDGALDRVLPQLAGRVRTARLQMLGTAPLATLRWPRPVYRRWGYDYWQQLPDGRLLLGGFRDREEAAEWTHDATPSDAVQAHLERFLREGLGVHEPITHRWAASVGYTDDELPILEEVERDLFAVGAYSGTGNVVGALCGRAAAQLAVEGRSDIADAFRS